MTPNISNILQESILLLSPKFTWHPIFPIYYKNQFFHCLLSLHDTQYFQYITRINSFIVSRVYMTPNISNILQESILSLSPEFTWHPIFPIYYKNQFFHCLLSLHDTQYFQYITRINSFIVSWVDMTPNISNILQESILSLSPEFTWHPIFPIYYKNQFFHCLQSWHDTQYFQYITRINSFIVSRVYMTPNISNILQESILSLSPEFTWHPIFPIYYKNQFFHCLLSLHDTQYFQYINSSLNGPNLWHWFLAYFHAFYNGDFLRLTGPKAFHIGGSPRKTLTITYWVRFMRIRHFLVWEIWG